MPLFPTSLAGFTTVGVNLVIMSPARNSTTVSRFLSGVHASEQGMTSTKAHAEALQRSLAMVSGVYTTFGSILLAIGSAAATSAASLEKLDIASRKIASNVGKTSYALDAQTKSIEKQSFTTTQALEAVNKLNIAQATFVDTAKLAAIAQDLAISKNIDAAKVLDYLTDSIAKASAESLNQLDIGITNTRLFNAWAKAHDTTAKALSTEARQQAVYNYILQKGTAFQGAYTEASDRTSVILDKLKVAGTNAFASLGAGALEVIKPFAKLATGVLDAFNSLGTGTKKFIGGLVTVVGGILLAKGALGMLKGTIGPLIRMFQAYNALRTPEAAEKARLGDLALEAEEQERLRRAQEKSTAAQSAHAKATDATSVAIREQVDAMKAAVKETTAQAQAVATGLAGGKARTNVDPARQFEHIYDKSINAAAGVRVLTDNLNAYLRNTPAYEGDSKRVSGVFNGMARALKSVATSADNVVKSLDYMLGLDFNKLAELYSKFSGFSGLQGLIAPTGPTGPKVNPEAGGPVIGTWMPRPGADIGMPTVAVDANGIPLTGNAEYLANELQKQQALALASFRQAVDLAWKQTMGYRQGHWQGSSQEAIDDAIRYFGGLTKNEKGEWVQKPEPEIPGAVPKNAPLFEPGTIAAFWESGGKQILNAFALQQAKQYGLHPRAPSSVDVNNMIDMIMRDPASFTKQFQEFIDTLSREQQELVKPWIELTQTPSSVDQRLAEKEQARRASPTPETATELPPQGRAAELDRQAAEATARLQRVVDTLRGENAFEVMGGGGGYFTGPDWRKQKVSETAVADVARQLKFVETQGQMARYVGPEAMRARGYTSGISGYEVSKMVAQRIAFDAEQKKKADAIREAERVAAKEAKGEAPESEAEAIARVRAAVDKAVRTILDAEKVGTAAGSEQVDENLNKAAKEGKKAAEEQANAAEQGIVKVKKIGGKSLGAAYFPEMQPPTEEEIKKAQQAQSGFNLQANKDLLEQEQMYEQALEAAKKLAEQQKTAAETYAGKPEALAKFERKLADAQERQAVLAGDLRESLLSTKTALADKLINDFGSLFEDEGAITEVINNLVEEKREETAGKGAFDEASVRADVEKQVRARLGKLTAPRYELSAQKLRHALIEQAAVQGTEAVFGVSKAAEDAAVKVAESAKTPAPQVEQNIAQTEKAVLDASAKLQETYTAFTAAELQKARELVAQVQRASVTILQRQGGFSAEKAVALIAELKRSGAIEPIPEAKGNQARYRVLLKPVEKAVEQAQQQAAKVTEKVKATPEPKPPFTDAELAEAIKAVTEAGKVTSELLSRQLRIGVRKAQALIGRMKELGIVAEQTGELKPGESRYTLAVQAIANEAKKEPAKVTTEPAVEQAKKLQTKKAKAVKAVEEAVKPVVDKVEQASTTLDEVTKVVEETNAAASTKLGEGAEPGTKLDIANWIAGEEKTYIDAVAKFGVASKEADDALYKFLFVALGQKGQKIDELLKKYASVLSPASLQKMVEIYLGGDDPELTTEFVNAATKRLKSLGIAVEAPKAAKSKASDIPKAAEELVNSSQRLKGQVTEITDELLQHIAARVREQNSASLSFIRQLAGVGYEKALDIAGQLERMGVIERMPTEGYKVPRFRVVKAAEQAAKAGETVVEQGLKQGIDGGEKVIKDAQAAESQHAAPSGTTTTNLQNQAAEGAAAAQQEAAKLVVDNYGYGISQSLQTIARSSKTYKVQNTLYDYGQAYEDWRKMAMPLPEEAAGVPGGKHFNTPLSSTYSQEGGWKLHLAVDPKSYAIVDKWLNLNWPGQYKLLHGGDQGEGDFTVYVGSGQMAKDVAAVIEKELGPYLEKSQSIGVSDLGITPHIGARFDIQNSLLGNRTGLTQYGFSGVPFNREAIQESSFLRTRKQLGQLSEKEYETQLNALLVSRRNAFSKQLAALYGSFYTDALNAADAKAANDNLTERTIMPNINKRMDAIVHAFETSGRQLKDRETGGVLTPEEVARKAVLGTNDLIRKLDEATDSYLRGTAEKRSEQRAAEYTKKVNEQLTALANLKQATPELAGEYDLRINAILAQRERRNRLIAKDASEAAQVFSKGVTTSLTTALARAPRAPGVALGSINTSVVKDMLLLNESLDQKMRDTFMHRLEVAKSWGQAALVEIDKLSERGYSPAGIVQSMSNNPNFKALVADNEENQRIVRAVITALDATRTRAQQEAIKRLEATGRRPSPALAQEVNGDAERARAQLEELHKRAQNAVTNYFTTGLVNTANQVSTGVTAGLGTTPTSGTAPGAAPSSHAAAPSAATPNTAAVNQNTAAVNAQNAALQTNNANLQAQNTVLNNQAPVLDQTKKGVNGITAALNKLDRAVGPAFYHLGYAANQAWSVIRNFATGNWLAGIVTAATLAAVAVKDAVAKQREKDLRKELGKTLEEQETQFSLYTEEMALADKARIMENVTLIELIRGKLTGTEKDIEELGTGLYQGTADIDKARELMRQTLLEQVRKNFIVSLWDDSYLAGLEKSINDYVDHLTLESIPDVYRAAEIGEQQLKKTIQADIPELLLAVPREAKFAATKAGNDFIDGIMRATDGLTIYVKVAPVGMAAFRMAVDKEMARQTAEASSRQRGLGALAGLAEAAVGVAETHKMLSKTLDNINDRLEIAEKTSADWQEQLDGVNDQLYHISVTERGLEADIQPFEDALTRAEAAATLITVPLERQRRAIEKNVKAAQKQLDIIKERHEEENKALEDAIERAQEKLEADQDRLKLLDWEVFIEGVKNKIRKQETSGRELALKTEKLILEDSIAMQEEQLQKMKDQLEEQKKRQELEVKAAEKQIEAAEAVVDALQEQIDAAQEQVTYAQEELDIRKAMQVEQRIAIENQRTLLEGISSAISHDKESVDKQIEKLKELQETAENALESTELMSDKVTEKVDENATAIENFGRALGRNAKEQAADFNEAVSEYESRIQKIPDTTKSALDTMPFRDSIPATLLLNGMVPALTEAEREITYWAATKLPSEIVTNIGAGQTLPWTLLTTGMDSATGAAYTRIDDMWHNPNPDDGIIANTARSAKEMVDAISPAQTEAEREVSDWVSNRLPSQIVTDISAGQTLPWVFLTTGMDAATGEAYTRINDMWHNPDPTVGIIANTVVAADEMVQAIADAFAKLPALVWKLLGGVGAEAGISYTNTGAPQQERKARGFEGMVTRPRNFLVGEAGPEYVRVTPMSQMIGGGTPVSRTVTSLNTTNNNNSTTITNNYNITGIYGQGRTPSRGSVVSDTQLAINMYH